jgi:tetratricopeptide (TPR) repeat protein
MNRVKCYALKGDLNSDKKSLGLSISDFTKAIELFPTSEAYKRRGLSNYAIKNIEEGKKDFKRAIELNPKDAEPYILLAAGEDDFKKRIVLLDKGIGLIHDDKDTPNLRRNAIGLRGITYYNNGKKKQACADFQQAMELGDKESEEYYNKYCRKRK